MHWRELESAGAEPARRARPAPQPAAPDVARLLALQRTAGNAAVGRMLARVKATTLGGEWNADPYAEWDHPQRLAKGVDIRLEFTPNLNAAADKIGLTQSIKAVKGNEQYRPTDDVKAAHAQEKLSVTGGAQKDWMIDRRYGNTNPIYGADDIPNTTGKTLGDTTFNEQQPGFSQLFERGVTDKAVLCDTPMRPVPLAANARMEFETTALAIAGPQKDSYYGSVTWGWTTNSNGVLAPIPFARKSAGNPTASFTESAQIWNQTSNKVRHGMQPKTLSGNEKVVYELQTWMSTQASELNIQIPLPGPEGPFLLPPKALFKAMKKAATQTLTPFSGQLATGAYGKLADAYNAQALNARRGEAAVTLTTLKTALDKMDNATGYWKSAQLKAKHFTPILKTIEGHQALVEDRRAG
jgi:hypothetical protein